MLVSETRDEFALVDTPAPYSDLRTVEPVRGMAGALTGSLPERRGRFHLLVGREDEPAWTLEEGAPSEGERAAVASR